MQPERLWAGKDTHRCVLMHFFRPNADPAHSQSPSHTLPQGLDEAVLVAEGAMWGSHAFPRRLACWCDLPEEFQEVDIVNKTMQQLAFA